MTTLLDVWAATLPARGSLSFKLCQSRQDGVSDNNKASEKSDTASYRYRAFISNFHQDEKWAVGLRNALETWGLRIRLSPACAAAKAHRQESFKKGNVTMTAFNDSYNREKPSRRRRVL